MNECIIADLDSTWVVIGNYLCSSIFTADLDILVIHSTGPAPPHFNDPLLWNSSMRKNKMHLKHNSENSWEVL